jgi:hypothetical protein
LIKVFQAYALAICEIEKTPPVDLPALKGSSEGLPCLHRFEPSGSTSYKSRGIGKKR